MDPYLHNQPISPFFHGILNLEIDYLERTYGEEELLDIFRHVTRRVYSPLIDDIKRDGVEALAKHMDQIMGLEDGEWTSRVIDKKLTITVTRDPAVAYLKRSGNPIAPNFKRITIELVNRVIAEASGYSFSVEYGASDEEYTQTWEALG